MIYHIVMYVQHTTDYQYMEKPIMYFNAVVNNHTENTHSECFTIH